ncbi:translational GTPase TypA [Mucisphaera sp.]|uniref:translational GTPase TypA n=1 Tax=Mucisphaera sp. TaxID=2913024 RepID=UPI003D10CEBE
MAQNHLRNVAIIAHVDHGKTTLTDQLLYQSGMFRAEELNKLAGGQHNLVMDTGDIERERGITITAKNCAVNYRHSDGADYKINIIDTPGHADFGGEVERVLNMADGCLLVVDAFEGPMPQTRFVLSKALAIGLKPLVVINKIDKPNARPEDVINEVFDLLGQLDAPDDALDFPVIYASAKNGWATKDPDKVGDDHPDSMADLYDAILTHIPAPYAEGSSRGANAGFSSGVEALAAPLQMSVTTIQYSEYVGRVAVGRVTAGRITAGQKVTVINRAGEGSQQRVLKLNVFDGLGQKEASEVIAGDVCAVVGLDPIDIGDTIACPDAPEALPVVKIDEPTLSMMFRVNDSPFASKEGTYVTSRQIWDRLQRELQSNVALSVERGDTGESFLVSGRGLMHLGVLLEEMRREGYELQVGRPQVIMKRPEEGEEHAGRLCEPIEQLVVDCPSECQNDVMSLVINRRAEIVRIDPKAGAGDYIHMEFTIPARGLIGLRTRMLTATQGRAIMHHNLLRYEPTRGEMPRRAAGVMIASDPGQVTAYSLDRLFDRGTFFVKPGDVIYAGQVVGEHCKDNDITVNLAINKKLTNVRAASADDQTKVKPARELSMEACLEYIAEDELVEITPESVRMRKRLLNESDRKRVDRQAKTAAKAGV